MTEMFKDRRKRGLFLATALSVSLAGCSSVPDALNPVEWYNSSANAIGGWFEDGDEDAVQDTGTYPNVASVPEKPEAGTTAVEREELREQLVSDRENARYDDSSSAPSIPSATQSLSEVKPVAPGSASPSTSSEDAEPVKPVRMTATDAATKQIEQSDPTTSRLPSQVRTGTATAARSSLWPNAPTPESAGDRPVTSARVGDPVTRQGRSAVERSGQPGPRYMRLTGQAEATETAPAPTQQPAAAPAPAPVAEPQVAAVPSAPASQPAPAPMQEAPAPVELQLQASESDSTGAVTLLEPAAGSFNFDDPSVIVDESALPAAFGVPGAGESYQAGVIRFGVGSARLSSADQGVIRELVPLIREYNASVEIVGHASSRTRDMDPLRHKMINFEVSLERANAVAAALINAGAPSDRVSVVAVGDSQPVSSEAMPAGEAENRRAEIFLVY